MNLRITPSFNTQQIQNSRQNPNFKMRVVEPFVVQHIASRLGEPMEKVLGEFVRPVSTKLAGEIGGLERAADLYISRLRNGCSGIYYTPADVRKITNDRSPLVKLGELITQAPTITKEAVDSALSEHAIQALNTEVRRHPGIIKLAEALWAAPKDSELSREVLNRLAVLNLFM